MSAVERSTSLQRTYRYLRIGVAGMVVVIFASIGVAAASVGWLTSLSDYYYTSARTPFVGALIAVGFALLALSGRGLERGLLDAAALFAPLVALLPTTLVPGTVTGIELPCRFRCFPPAYEADAATGIATYLIVGTVVVVVGAMLVAMEQVPLASFAVSGGVAVGVLTAVGLAWLLARDWMLAQGHFAATVAFFALFAIVAVLAAFPRRSEAPARVFRASYVTIAVLLLLVLVAYIAFLPRAEALGIPLVLVAEAGALVLFSAFWVVQGIEKWDETSPSLR
ncbi:hypothetical protein [Microbacterium sp.]|uniref:hypothetical protein n=1 Tax=Microbacterium sp. TaxID=51671 RepID=UPI003C75A603